MLPKISVLFLGAIALSLSFFACDPPVCGDPALVSIPLSDASAPTATWIVTVLTQTPSGPISALTPYSDASNNVTVKTSDQVTITFQGKDEESGVKYLETKGGFGYTCTATGNAIAVDGFIPSSIQDLSVFTVCAPIQWSLPKADVNVNLSCTPPRVYSSGGIGFTGIVRNHKDMETTSTLHFNVVP